MAESRTLVIRVDADALDDARFLLGVIRIAPDRSIRFINRGLKHMLGDQIAVGMRVTDLPMDAANQATLETAMGERFGERRATDYQLVVQRPDLGTLVRLQIAAVPEYAADGALVGAIGIIVDQTRDSVATAIHSEIERAVDPTQLLGALARHLRELIPFDTFMVTAIGKDNVHLRNLIDTPDPPAPTSPYRWWPMPEFVKVMLRDLVPGPFDLDSLYLNEEYARLSEKDPPAMSFRKRDFRHSLRLRVLSKGMQVAIISLLRKRGQPEFTNADLATCNALPVVDAVASAMALEEQQQHHFAVDLIASLTKAGDSAMQVAQHLVDRLWEHFQWEHVSLFRVLEDRGRVRLVCQAKNQKYQLRDGFEQSIEKGLLGRCARTEKVVNVGRVHEDADYEVGIAGMESELVMPLPGSRVRWMLNIESSDIDAFADEEQHAVEMLLQITAVILERTALLELRMATMDNVADAIIQTNHRNTIWDVNIACTRLLDRKREEMIGRDLTSFLAVESQQATSGEAETSGPWERTQTGTAEVDEKASSLVQSDVRASEVVRFTKGDGSTISMLVSTATLPGELGGKVFIASDLSGKIYLDRVGRLTPIFRQLASAIRVPLALASTFLEDFADDDHGPEHRELIEKVQKQIRDADVSVERVMKLASDADGAVLERTSFDLRRVFQHVRASLPQEYVRAIPLRAEASTPIFVSAAYPELVFCVKGLLAHLLHIRRDGQEIDIEMSSRAGRGRANIVLELRGASSDGPVPPVGDRPDDEAVDRLEGVISPLMKRMSGDYVGPMPGEHRFELGVALAD